MRKRKRRRYLKDKVNECSAGVLRRVYRSTVPRVAAPGQYSGVGVDLSTSLVRMIGPRQNSAQVVTTLTHQFSRAFKPLKSHPSHSPSSPPAWQTTSRLDTWPTQSLNANTNSTSQTIYATPPWLAKAASLATVSGS